MLWFNSHSKELGSEGGLFARITWSFFLKLKKKDESYCVGYRNEQTTNENGWGVVALALSTTFRRSTFCSPLGRRRRARGYHEAYYYFSVAFRLWRKGNFSWQVSNDEVVFFFPLLRHKLSRLGVSWCENEDPLVVFCWFGGELDPFLFAFSFWGFRINLFEK